MADQIKKNVILIGFTQNGKSSLVQQLLQYSGYDDSLIKIGSGNVSETQICSLYEIAVPFRQHFLVDSSTLARIDPSLDTNRRDVRDDDVEGVGSVRLNIIDTPGLSDSSNLKELNRERGDDNSSPRAGYGMAVVDERHKLAIYQALLRVGEIHAVCFVIKENYGGELQKAVREFIQVFNLTLPNEEVSYYVVHTNINPTDRFSDKLSIRERDFNRFAGVRACHHFVDNLPSSKNPIARYFAKRALAGFVKELADEPGVAINTVVYPRGTQHLTNDRQLRTVMRAVAASYEEDFKSLKDSFSRLKLAKSHADEDYKDLSQRLEKKLLEIRSKDTNEDEEVMSGTCTATSSWTWAWGTAEITVHSKTTISAWKVTDIKGGSFGETIENHGRKVTGTLTSNFMTEASATLRVYSKKKDVHAAKLRALCLERDELGPRVSSAFSDASELGLQNSRLKADMVQCTSAIQTLRGDMNIVSGQVGGFVMSPGPNKLAYFTAANIYAAGLGYCLKGSISKSKLPSNNIDEDQVLQEIVAKKAEMQHILPTRRLTVLVIAGEIKLKKKLRDPVRALLEKTIVLRDSLEKRIEAFDSIALSLPDNEGGGNEEMELLRRLEKTARTQLSRTSNDATGAMDEELQRLEKQQSSLFDALEGIQGVIDKMEQKKAEWVLDIDHLGMWIAAADVVMDMVRQKMLPAGAFAVITREIEADRANPYLKLWQDVWEAMRVEKWAKQTKMCIYRERIGVTSTGGEKCLVEMEK